MENGCVLSAPSLHRESTDSLINSKNIFIKMLKDVGIAVPKTRETSSVYMPQDMIMAYNNNTMRNPILKRVRSTVECRFESYSGSHFFGNESRVCCGCKAGLYL